MNLKNTLLTIISSALLATSAAHAVVYTDTDIFNGLTGQLVNFSSPLTGTFDISTQDDDGIFDLVGYNNTQLITSAIASFTIVDDNPFSLLDGAETVTINLGPDMFVNSQATFLIAFGDVTGNALFDLRQDGVLAYSIVASTPTSGDFKAINGSLVVTVPDGGTTAVLLGIGFLGIYAAQRKLALAR